MKFSLFTQLCVSIPMTLYILWRLHRTWKLSSLPTFQIFQFQTLKYVQLKFFNSFWRRISGHLKNNYVFTWVWHPFYLFPLSHEFTVIFLLLLYLLTAFASRWLSTHTHTHKFTFTLSYNYIGKKNPQKQKNRVNLKQCGGKYPSVDNNIGKVVKALKMIDEIFFKKT